MQMITTVRRADMTSSGREENIGRLGVCGSGTPLFFIFLMCGKI